MPIFYTLKERARHALFAQAGPYAAGKKLAAAHDLSNQNMLIRIQRYIRRKKRFPAGSNSCSRPEAKGFQQNAYVLRLHPRNCHMLFLRLQRHIHKLFRIHALLPLFIQESRPPFRRHEFRVSVWASSGAANIGASAEMFRFALSHSHPTLR